MESSFDSLDEATRKNVLFWLNGSFDEKTKSEIKNLSKDYNSLQNAFFQKISFGTGGARGIMGVGTNRINKYTIRAIVQGLANYLKKTNKKNSVLIGYDTRNNSALFAEECARVLAKNGIKSYLFKNPTPTPLVSFGCRYKKCSSAIMITASHNPPEYNGIKVYWNDGGQVLPPHDKNIISEVNAIDDPSSILVAEKDDPLIEQVEDEIFDSYLKKIKEIESFPSQNKDHGHDLQIVYTSLHGTGMPLLPKALKTWGFDKVILVQSQCAPDGNFPNAPKPNPEEKEALQLGIELLLEKKGDLLIATDPDADRMGVVINHRGVPIILTGNQIASLLVQHICQNSPLPKNSVFIKTIVTTELFAKIVASYGKTCLDVLTGFKYIGEKISLFEKSKEYSFIFGAEESLGFLRENFIRDKDGISAACLLSEMALAWKMQNKTLVDALNEIYQKYGVFRESLISLSFEEGKKGIEKISSLMAMLRDSTPKKFGAFPINTLEDYKKREKIDLKTGKKAPLDLPPSDVLRFFLEDGSKIVIRPSGTEPKIKIYLGVTNQKFDSLGLAVKECDEKLGNLKKILKEELGL